MLLAYLDKQTLKKEMGGWQKMAANKYQKRFFRLYPDMLLMLKKEGDSKPIGMIPLHTVLYVAHVEKEQGGVRFDTIIQADPETWIFSLKAETQEAAKDWVQKLKAGVESSQKLQRRLVTTSKNDKSLQYEVAGKFWKSVQEIALVYHRRQTALAESSPLRRQTVEAQLMEADRRLRQSSVGSSGKQQPDTPLKKSLSRLSTDGLARGLQGAKLVRSGVLLKKSPKGFGLWQERQVELYVDSLVYRDPKNQGDVKGHIPMKLIQQVSKGKRSVYGEVELKVEMIQEEGLKKREYFFKTKDMQEADNWLEDLNRCLAVLGSGLSEDEARVLAKVSAANNALSEGDFQTALHFYQEALRMDPENPEANEGLQQAQTL
eukprot:g1287.t1